MENQDGTTAYYESHWSEVHNNEGRVPAVVDVRRDVTERRRAEADLKESRQRYRNLFDNSLSGIIYADVDGSIVDVNQRMLDIVGSPGVEASKTVNLLTYPPLVEIGAADDFRRCLVSRTTVFGEKEYATKWGKPVLLKYYFNPIERDGKTVGVLANIDDGSALRAAESALRARNTEMQAMIDDRDLLLRELYHRTKNNLQLVASIVSLRMNDADSVTGRRILAEIERRIQGIAIVHEKLFLSESLSQIDLGEYLRDVTTLVTDNFRSDVGCVDVVHDFESIPGLIDVAIPLGLIANELLTNAFRHAFPDGIGGRVRMRMRAVDESRVEFIVEDNGAGLPEAVDPATVKTLGLQTVLSIVQDQLGGTVSVDRRGGTCWRIEIDTSGFYPRV